MKTVNLKVGTRVVALRRLDPRGARVSRLERGTVIEAKTRGRSMATGKQIGPVFGPLVEWDTGGVCNVYAGQVAVLPNDVED